MTTTMHFAHHGGALDAARATFADAPEPWIDLSTGINPHAFPVGIVAAKAWARLPEAAALAELEAAAAERYGCPPEVAVVAAPGTQAIIQRLPALFSGRDVRILGRTYGEYARVFTAAGADVRVVAELGALAEADVAVVVNPNNPDGQLIAAVTLAALAKTVGMLVVDEAFMDALEPARSLVPQLPAPRTLVLRSFGKFYGLAGLRLGFALGPPAIATVLREALGPWAVAGPALAIGTTALADAAWAEASRDHLAAEAAQLDAMLGEAGLRIVGGTPLFRLASHARAPAIFAALAQAGILTRPFADELTWLRFGLPGTPAAWARLEAALAVFA